MDLFGLVFFLDFGIQALFGSVALLLDTEKFFDFVGSLTFILCGTVSYYQNTDESLEKFKFIQCCFICLWAGKLGTFLLARVLKEGEDKRFREIKKDKSRFFKVWMIQGAWVYLNMIPSIFVFQGSSVNTEREVLSTIGWSLFLFGLLFETVADYQKTMFRADPSNKGKFITTGLWSISRHPNYFGEILLWYGMWLAAVPFFTSPLAYLSVLCPTLTALQITYLSGVPMLEKSGIEKWGNEEDYVRYMEKTPCLLPFIGAGKKIKRS
eukprot:sb/3468247/